MFIINPFFCALFSFFLILTTNKTPNYLYYCLFVFLAGWLGIINMTKVPMSDFERYVANFYCIPEISFIDLLKYGSDGSGKEPLYSLIIYFGYYFTFGQARIYFWLLTVIMYGFMFMSIFKFMKQIQANKTTLLCSVIVIAFFDQFFLFTAHLIRQILASTIVMYAIIRKNETGRNQWILLIASILIHTSSMLIVILSLVPFMYKRLKFYQFGILSLILMLATGLSALFSNMLSNVGMLGYALNRLSEEGADDGVSVSIVIILSIFMPMILIDIIQLIRIRNRERNSMYPILYLSMFLMLFVLSLSRIPLLQYRFFYYIYVFLPFILPLLFFGYNRLLNTLYCSVISLLFVFRFFFLHNNSAWIYYSMTELLLYPTPYYFLFPQVY